MLGHRIQKTLVTVFIEDLVLDLGWSDKANLTVSKADQVLDSLFDCQMGVTQDLIDVVPDLIQHGIDKVGNGALEHVDVLKRGASQHDGTVELGILNKRKKPRGLDIGDKKLWGKAAPWLMTSCWMPASRAEKIGET